VVEPDLGLRRADLPCECMKLVDERHRSGSINGELILANHVHQLDASEHVGRCAKGLKAQHRPGQAFDRPMVLPDDVVRVFHLP
jgi:hypothetical protein